MVQPSKGVKINWTIKTEPGTPEIKTMSRLISFMAS